MTPMNGWRCCLDDMGLCYGTGLRDGVMFGWHAVMLRVRIKG